MQVIDFIDFNAVTSALSSSPTMKRLFLAVTNLDGKTLSSTSWRRVCHDFHRINPNTQLNCAQSGGLYANAV